MITYCFTVDQRCVELDLVRRCSDARAVIGVQVVTMSDAADCGDSEAVQRLLE